MLWVNVMKETVNRILHLVNEQGYFYTYKEFAAKYGNCINWVHYYNLLSTIPDNWYQYRLKEGDSILHQSKLDKLKLKKQCHSSIIYSQLIAYHNWVNGICVKWSYLLRVHIDYETYLKNFLNGYFSTISTKLRDFHYRLMANGIVTNRNLYHWKILNHDRCTFCNNARKTIIHLLL